MFSGQFAVYVTTHAQDKTHGPDIDKDDDESMRKYYVHTRVPMQNACLTSEYADDPNAAIKCLTYVVNEDTGVTIHVCQLMSSLSFHNTNTHFQPIFPGTNRRTHQPLERTVRHTTHNGDDLLMAGP